MGNYQSVTLEKSMYHTGEGFLNRLESLDPSRGYEGTELSGLDALERQLKRFDIKVSGPLGDRVEKFFQDPQSATLFPAYLARAVEQGMKNSPLDQILAAKTVVNTPDYRSISSTASGKEDTAIAEGGDIPATQIRLKDHLVTLNKRGRMLSASYEAIRFQRLELFAVTLRQIGNSIARRKLKDAVTELIGTGDNAAEKITCATAGTLAYADLLKLWEGFEDYEMNLLLASPDMAAKILSLPECSLPGCAAAFAGPDAAMTPFGAVLVKSDAVPAGTVIALDKNCALEMVSCGGVTVDADKVIDCQLERVAITETCGFAKIFPGAVKVLTLNA